MTAVGKAPHESVEAFAALRARLLDPFADRARVLAEHGLPEHTFAAIEAAWCERLAAGDGAAEQLARAFGDVHAASVAAGRGGPVAGKDAAGRGRVEEPGALTASPAAGEAPRAIEAPRATEASPATPAAMPSFLKDRAITPAVLARTPDPPPSQAAPPGHYTGTGEVDVSAIFRKPLPFDPTAKPTAAPPSAATPAHSEQRAPLSGETVDVDVGAIARRALAFGPAGAPPQVSARAAEPPGPPVSGAGMPPGPVRAAEPTGCPPFTLDRYALLSAEIAMVGTDPAARSAVFVRFGVDDPDALTAQWRARFGADPALAGRWSAAYAHHYGRLRAERGGGR